MLLVPLNSLKDRTIKRVNISSSQVRQIERKTVREREGEREEKATKMPKPSPNMIRMLIIKKVQQKPNNFYCFDKCYGGENAESRNRDARSRGLGSDIFQEFRVLFMFVQLICIPLMSRPVAHSQKIC